MTAIAAPAPSLHRAIWAIALPAMLTNVATALFGLADIWTIGQLGDAAAQGSVELGAKFMMGLLVVFNFLRSGTVALTAQAAGRAAAGEAAAVLARGLGLALLIGVGLLLLWPVAVPVGLRALEAEGAVAEAARRYIDIRYAGGVAWLLNAALVGWLIGRKRVRAVLAVEVAANAVHVALDLLFVLGLGWGVAGVAVATLVSEGVKLLALAVIVARDPAARPVLAALGARSTWAWEAIGATLAMNRDLFLRTLLLTAAMLILTRAGAQQGATVLAANGILFQLFMLSALLLDGFESSAQVLCGEAAGARDDGRMRRLVGAQLGWGLALAALIAVAYAAAGPAIAASFSTDPGVVAVTRAHLGWAIVIPLIGVVSFVLDGVFIGAGWTRAMLLTMVAAFLAYVATLFAADALDNHGVWLAFTLFLAARAGGQLVALPGLMRRSFA
jgi:MATE family multidrug resistance protein